MMNDGWKLVPVEPTPEMLAATSWPKCAETDYRHMLDAAPTPPAQQDDEALEVLRELMLWIENWGCAFHDDPEWPETDAKVRALLTKRGAA